MTTIKVLLIEDDRDDARLTQDLLGDAARASFLLETAYTGLDGLSLLKRNRFDVVLLDYKLPDMDGLVVIREMERMHYQMPVVLITSHGDRNLQAKALEVGAVEYLEKGTLTTDLLERTCLYAIGLNEKKIRNGSGPGVGPMIEQLVELTRESVRAQMEHATEIRELRKELSEGILGIRSDAQVHQKKSEERQEAITEEISNLSGVRWVLKWIVQHPLAAVLLFMGLILGVLLVSVLLQVLDLSKVNQVREILGG